MSLRNEWYMKRSAAAEITTLPVRVGVIGAGDVGRNLLLGLRLLGGGSISSLSFWEKDEKQAQRVLHEVALIRSVNESLIAMSFCDDLSRQDIVVFSASGGVPALGEEKRSDVRILQFGANTEILKEWVQRLEGSGFKGLYFILSDPVDFLCQYAVEKLGLSSRRVIGFGQGVMYARAAFYGGIQIHVYGPHGAGLWVANDPAKYDPILSEELTRKTREENIYVRHLGFKPYIAPAFASGALSMLSYIRSEPHYASHFTGEIYWGELYRLQNERWETNPIEDERLLIDVMKTYERCKRDVRDLLDSVK